MLLLLIQFVQAQTAIYEYNNLGHHTTIASNSGAFVICEYHANGNSTLHTIGSASGVALDLTIQNESAVSETVQQGSTLSLNGAEAKIGCTEAMALYVCYLLSANNTLDASDIH
jgi:hypothetical protein